MRRRSILRRYGLGSGGGTGGAWGWAATLSRPAPTEEKQPHRHSNNCIQMNFENEQTILVDHGTFGTRVRRTYFPPPDTYARFWRGFGCVLVFLQTGRAVLRTQRFIGGKTAVKVRRLLLRTTSHAGNAGDEQDPQQTGSCAPAPLPTSLVLPS